MLTSFASHQSRRLFKRRDSKLRGVVSIEFALLAPIIILFIFGTIEMSLLFLTQHVMENAAYNASRVARTGFVAEESTQTDTVQGVLRQRLDSLSPLLNINNVTITTVAYASLSDFVNDQNAQAASLGASTQIMLYTVSYPWRFITPFIGTAMGYPEGTMPIQARIVVRNEPY